MVSRVREVLDNRPRDADGKFNQTVKIGEALKGSGLDNKKSNALLNYFMYKFPTYSRTTNVIYGEHVGTIRLEKMTGEFSRRT